ncbi:MAG: hypothetical protein PVF17_12850 [Ignavibacteria bacterium]|jgi:hypothetical protein
MKKLILLFCAVFLLTSFTNAQNYGKQGVWELGGMVMYANTTLVANGETVDGSVGVFFANVPAYYFIMEGLQIGIIPEFVSVSVSEELAGSETTLSAFGGYVSAAYVFKTGGNVYPFLEGRFGYNSVNVTTDIALIKSAGTQQAALDETLSGIGFGFSGGIKVQIARGALLNFGVGYQMRTVNPEDYDGDRNGINVIVASAGFSIFLGR